MIKAIYREREDGDFDFVASFSDLLDNIYMLDQAECYKYNLEMTTNDTFIIREFDDLQQIVDVLVTQT